MKKLIKVVCLFLLVFTLFACDKEEVKPEEIKVIGQLQEYYGKGVDIDLNSINIEIKYTNNETKKFSLFDEEVTYDDFDTSEVGEKVINISCLGLTTTIKYEVVEYTLTLDFQDGTFENESSKAFVADNNTIDISAIIPTPNDETKEFAGWFYDKELTQRANSIMDGVYLVNENLTLYAGYDTNYEGSYQYTITDNGEAILTFYDLFSDFENSSLVIPATVELYPVVEIANDFIDTSFASYAYWINSIEFPENSKVRTIGDNSFANLGVTNIVLPSTLEKIGNGAFTAAQVVYLTLPKSLKYIGEHAFDGCVYLTDVDFNDSELLTIGNYAFANCINLSVVNLSNKVETIGSYAFSSCFELYEAHISKSVSSIGLGTFANLPRLRNIYVDEENQYFSSNNGHLLSKNGKIFYRYCYGREDTSYELPSTVEVLHESCFDITSEISNLSTLILNEGLVEISSDSFKNTKLDFTIPSTVERIGFGAFSEWQGTEFKVSENNKNFAVLNKCLVSKDGTILYSVPNEIEEDSFYLPDSIKEIKSYAIGRSQTIKTIIIGENSELEMIDEYGINPFFMTNLNSIIILRDTPFAIADNAFTGDSNIVLNDTFVIIVNENKIDEYKIAWANYSSFIDRDILGFITIPSSYYDSLVAGLSEYAYVTSTSSFYQYGKLFLTVNEGNRFALLKEIEAIDSLLSIFNDINTQSEYVISLYEEWINQHVTYFKDADNEQFTNPNYSFEIFNKVYAAIPNDVKVLFKNYTAIEEQMTALTARYNDVASKRKDIISQLLDFESSKDSFDNVKYENIMKSYNEYAAYNYRISDLQNLKLNILDCSHKVYKLLNTEYTLDNLMDLYDNFYGNQVDNIFGVQQYLTTYLDLPVYYNSVYMVDKVDEIEANLIKLINDSLEEVSDYFTNYNHPETYDNEQADKDLEFYQKLGFRVNDLDFTVTTEYQKVMARYIMNDFITIAKNGINDGNLYELSHDHDLLAYYVTNEPVNEFILGLTEYTVYQAYEAQFIEIYNNVIDDIIDAINEVINNDVLTNYKDFEAVYNRNVDFFSNVMLKLGDYVLGINHLKNVIECAYMIQTVITTDVTAENYEELFNIINGEDGIEEKLSEYEQAYFFADIISVCLSDEDFETYKQLLKNF